MRYTAFSWEMERSSFPPQMHQVLVASNRRGKLAARSSVKASFCSPARNFLSNAVPQNVECNVKECIALTFFFFFYWFELRICGFPVNSDQIYSFIYLFTTCLSISEYLHSKNLSLSVCFLYSQ